MKTWKIITAIIALSLILVAATAASAYVFWGRSAQSAYNPSAGATNQYVGVPTSTTNSSTQNLAPVTQTNTQTPTLYTPYNPQIAAPGYPANGGWGCPCMGGWGYGGSAYPNAGTASTPLTISQVVQIAQTYVASLNNPDLTVKQVEEYTAAFYVQVAEKSTGNGAFELLINTYTGAVTAEPGPNMMWNTKYTFTTGYCNWFTGTITTTPTVTVDQAKTNAQQYLNTYLAGTTVGDVTTFYGYYTIEVLSNGNTYGLLSVNAFTGQVWYHTWLGAFIQEINVS